jgi:hypothetical protein
MKSDIGFIQVAVQRDRAAWSINPDCMLLLGGFTEASGGKGGDRKIVHAHTESYIVHVRPFPPQA